MKTDTFRKEYSSNHDLHELVVAMKNIAEKLEEFYNKIPEGREMSISRTKLEESIMWATKAIFYNRAGIE
jgi:hypothetical protein